MYISPPRPSHTPRPIWTKLGTVGVWLNVITPNYFEPNRAKAVDVVRG